MIELQKIVKQLLKLQNHYFTLMTNGMNPVVVHPKDYHNYTIFLEELINKVKKYSNVLLQRIENIRKELVLFQPMTNQYVLNIYRFGALGSTLAYLESDEFVCHYIKSLTTPWEDINEAIEKLILEYSKINNRLDFNKVGVVAREIYIMIANKVYNPKVHRTTNNKGVKIGSADAKEMLSAYVEKEVDDKKLISYISEAIKLAEPVTHTKKEVKQRAQILIIAVLNVVEIISSLYNTQ